MHHVGELSAISDLIRVSPSNITWNPPFSLDLTNIEPNIIYCIEVYNTTCQEGGFLFSDCNVTTSYYVSDDLLDDYTYNITVIARSNVKNAPNENSSTILGKLQIFCLLAIYTIILHVCIQNNM